MKNRLRVSEKNKSARLRPILVRIQGAFASAYLWICAGGCNEVDGPKEKQDGGCIFFRGPDSGPMRARHIYPKFRNSPGALG